MDPNLNGPPTIILILGDRAGERNAIARDGFNIRHSARGPELRKDFFWPSPVFGTKILRKTQSARGSTQCKSGPSTNMVCRRNYLLYIFQ